MGDLGSFGQQAQGVHEAKLLAPSPEGHACILLKQPLHGSDTSPGFPADLRERKGIRWIGDEQRRNSRGSGICQARELKRNCLDSLKLIEDEIDEVKLGTNRFLQRAECAGVENELAQQWRNIPDAAAARQSFSQAGFQVKRAHRDLARHRDGVRNPRGNPDGAVCGHDPGAFIGADGHDTPRSVNELVAIVKVQRDHVVSRVIVSQGRDGGPAVAGTIEDCGVTFLRH